jgi:hypothetical protein
LTIAKPMIDLLPRAAGGIVRLLQRISPTSVLSPGSRAIKVGSNPDNDARDFHHEWATLLQPGTWCQMVLPT